LIVEISLATKIPVSAWLAEDDEVIATVVAIFDEHARERRRK
jgi:hypothetical protein